MTQRTRFCGGTCFPNVDGIEYVERQFPTGMGVHFFNNGVAELFIDLNSSTYSGKPSDIKEHMIYARPILYNMKEFINNYLPAKARLTYSNRLFLAFSIFGCKACISDVDEYRTTFSRIDRNRIISTPVLLEDTSNGEIVLEAIENFTIDFLLSRGVIDLSKKDVQ